PGRRGRTRLALPSGSGAQGRLWLSSLLPLRSPWQRDRRGRRSRTATGRARARLHGGPLVSSCVRPSALSRRPYTDMRPAASRPAIPDTPRLLRGDRVLTRPVAPRIIPILTRSRDAEMRSNLFGITGFGPGLARPKADAP